MTSFFKRPARLLGVLLAGLAVGLPWQPAQAEHDIRGITGTTFNLYAYPANIPLPEGTSLYMWLFGDADAGTGATHPEGAGYALPQYPGPTLVVNQGDAVTINVTNYGIPHPVSLVVTGHEVSSTGGSAGLLGQAASIGDTAPTTYTFTASKPGTYLYHSLNGPNPGLHVEMGLLGVLIVRPDPETNTGRNAYGDNSGTDYDHEYLYLLTEVDPDIHAEMELGHYTHFTNADRFAEIWFVNGRVFPDLLQADFDAAYAHQPYKSLAMAHPTDQVLIRNINAGHDSHPFHYHGENVTFLAQDGRILSSDGVKANLGRSDNTINSAPKQAVDALWVWTGKGLGWDIYGHDTNHTCTDDDGDGFADATSTYPGEYCPDHGKAFPVTLPGVGELTLGAWYSGSPFLGDVGDLPPGEGGLNPFGGYFFVWHSHAEKELTTFDIFPGGTLSAVVVLPPSVPIQ